MNHELVLILALIVLPLCGIYSQSNTSDTYTQEKRSFHTKSGYQLDGILTLPRSFKKNDVLVIMVTPPQPHPADYHGAYSELAYGLGRNGIATFMYNNRAFTDSALVHCQDEGKVDMYDIANDAHDAYEYLRQDSRFKDATFGFLGHSEGGTASLIECARNTDDPFLIQLASFTMNGADFLYGEQTELPNYAGIDTAHTTILEIYYNHIKTAKKYNGLDSIRMVYRQMSEELFKNPMKVKHLYNGQIKGTPEGDFAMHFKYYTRRHEMAYIKLCPEELYRRIKSPMLMVAAWGDYTTSGSLNIAKLEKTLFKCHKKNFQIMAFDLTHSLYKSENMRNKTKVLADWREIIAPAVVQWIKGNVKTNINV